MNIRNRYLTAILLVLIGVVVGSLLVLLQQGAWVEDQAEVKFTEIKTSNIPLFTNDQLEKLDSRFLFKNIADKVVPSVVYINAIITLNEARDEDSFWGKFHSRRARTVGSGVIITQDGYIVTNNHVIDGAVSAGVRVVLDDRRVFEARVVGSDQATDLAVLKIEATQLPAVVMGNSDRIDVGEWVLAIGNPFQLRSTVTAGIVSALGRQIGVRDEADNPLRIESYIQTDAAINKGNSGGALVNTSGQLIGINTAIASRTGSYQGYGFAVPSNIVRKVAHDLIQYGEVRRALLGVSILGMNYKRAQQLGLDAVKGVEVMALSPDGAARQYGVKTNDLILAVNNQPVYKANELQREIAVLHPGETVRLKIWRDGEIIYKEVVLDRLKEAAITEAKEQPSFGKKEESLYHEEIPHFNFKAFSSGFRVAEISREDSTGKKLLITRVSPSSEAGRQGLKEGFIIKKVGRESINGLKEFAKKVEQQLSNKGKVMLQVETKKGGVGFYWLKR